MWMWTGLPAIVGVCPAPQQSATQHQCLMVMVMRGTRLSSTNEQAAEDKPPCMPVGTQQTSEGLYRMQHTVNATQSYCHMAEAWQNVHHGSFA